MSPKVFRIAFPIAFGLGAALALLSASTLVAWQFGFPRQMGQPLIGWWYAPWDAIRWYQAWGHTAAYWPEFQSGLINVAFVLIGPVAILRAVQLYAQSYLPMQADETQSGLGKPDDLHDSGHIHTKAGGFVIGRSGRRIYASGGDQHLAVIGAAGAGKTSTTGIPTALRHQGPMFIIDPSGSIIAAAGRHRGEIGPTHIFDPTKRGTARFNPLLEMPAPGEDGLIADCQTKAAMLCCVTKGYGPGSQFWNETAGYLVSGLLYHARCSDDPTLGHVWRMLAGIDANKYPVGMTGLAAEVIEGFRKREPKLRDSIVTTAITHLKFLADPLIQSAVAMSDFHASDLLASDDPTTIAITVPEDRFEHLRPLVRLMLQAVIKSQMHSRWCYADGRVKKEGAQALVLIDDFPALGYMEVIEDGLADARKYGLRFGLMAQTMEQIEKNYGANQSIFGICGTIVLTPGFSRRGLDAAVSWGGKHTVIRTSRQRSLGFKWAAGSATQSQSAENVLNPRDMFVRAKNEVLVFTAGCHPTYLEKIRYWEDRAFRGLFDDPRRPPAAQDAAVPATPTGVLPPWLTPRTP